MNIEYKINTSSYDDLCQHLNDVDNDFIVPLSQRVNILEYAQKLYAFATRVEAWNNGILIGLVAYYHNSDKESFHISNVSVVKRFQKKAIATELLEQTKRNAKIVKIRYIDLIADVNLIDFYKKEGFDIGRQIDSQSYEMRFYLHYAPIMVSICCLVYNHAEYLRRCLDGFISQRTNFNIEILIHDDSSTDGSAEIINEYEKKYPKLFKPIYQTINQYSRGVSVSQKYQFSRARGKFIAVCEGDDYWTDPLKLQKQVDFLEEHQDYSMCCHSVNYEANGEIVHNNKINDVDTTIPVEDIIKNGGLYIALASIVYRRELAVEMPSWRKMADVGDYPLYILLALKGKIHYLSDIMGVYRWQHAGSWTSSMKENKLANIKHAEIECKWMEELDKETDYKYTQSIHYHLWKFYEILYLNEKIKFSVYFNSVFKGQCKKAYTRLLKDFLIINFPHLYKLLKRK